MSVKYRHTPGRMSCSSSQAKPGRKSVPPPALDRDLVGKIVGGVLGRVLQRGVDLEDDDALRLELCRDLAQLGPELGKGRRRQRSRGVDDDRDRVDALGADRGQVEPAIDEAPVGQAPAIVAARGVGHVAAQQRAPIQHARVGALHRLLDPARRLALGLGEIEGLVHGLVPGLLLGDDIHGRLVRLAVAAAAGARVHDLSGAGGIMARRRVGPIDLTVPVPAISILVAAIVRVIGGAVGLPVIATGRRQAGRPGAGACARRRVGVVAGISVLRLGQTVVGLLDTEPVPCLGLGRQREACVAHERVGDELRGLLPALRVTLAPARVVLECAGHHHARHRSLDDMGVGVRDPSGRVADLVPVARQRLAARIGAEREPKREAAEEGLLAQELGHGGAGALRRFRLHARGHHAASRAASAGASALGSAGAAK